MVLLGPKGRLFSFRIIVGVAVGVELGLMTMEEDNDGECNVT